MRTKWGRCQNCDQYEKEGRQAARAEMSGPPFVPIYKRQLGPPGRDNKGPAFAFRMFF